MNTSDTRTGPTPGAHTGTLTVAAVPIGRPGDASPLLAQALASAPVIAAEDTRRVRKLVAAAAAAGAAVTVLPGPSAVIAALAVSGLPTDRFCFEGFPPRKTRDRAQRFAELAGEPRTMVFFESPRRLATTLADLSAAFGADRQAVVCRELTKTHEEVRRGTLAELAAWAADGVLGEVTLVVGGAAAGSKAGAPTRTAAEAAGEAARRIAAGQPRNAAIAAVAQESGLRRAEVYDAVLAARRARDTQDTRDRP